MTIDDPVHRGDLPPPVDLAGHFRELGRAFLPALLIAVVVGGLVFGLRTALVPKEYEASIITQITPAQTLVPGDAFIEQMRAPFMGLAQDTNVLNEVLSQVDTGWTAETLNQHVTLTPGPAPQMLVFTVNAGSPGLAREIVRAMVTAVSQASVANHARDTGRQLEALQATIAAEEARNTNLAPDDPAKADSDKQLGEMRAQLITLQNSGGDQLTISSVPEPDTSPVSPQPVSEALVAGLAALIVAAELIVLWRSRIGKKPNRTWARRVARKYRAGFTPDPVPAGELPPLVAVAVTQGLRADRGVLVLVGDKATLSRSALPSRQSLNGHHQHLFKADLGDDWWNTLDTNHLAAALVVISAAGSDRKATELALRQLARLGVHTELVLQRAKRSRRATSLPEPAGSAEAAPNTGAPTTSRPAQPLTEPRHSQEAHHAY